MIIIEVLKLIDQLEALVSSGMRVPLTSRTVIDEQEFLDIIDRLRVAIPDEIRQAKRASQERERPVPQTEADDMLASARAQAAQMLERAQAAQSFEKDEQVVNAREQAELIIGNAQRSAEEMQRGADDYAAEILTTLEAELTKYLAGVRKGKATLERGKQRTESYDNGSNGRLGSSERLRDLDY